MKRAFLMLPLLALAACGNGAGNSAAPAAPVAAASPPAGQSWLDTVVKTDGGYRVGNPDAPIKLVEYGARSCPTCGAFSRESARPLEDKYIATGKVSFEFRDFLVHGVMDLPGAVLGQCAGPGPFFALLDAMYADQNRYLDAVQGLTPADQQALQTGKPTDGVTMLATRTGMIDFVKQRGIPEARARQCLADQATLEALSKRTEGWGQDGTVTGTPTFFINGEKYTGAPAWPDVEAALRAAGA